MVEVEERCMEVGGGGGGGGGHVMMSCLCHTVI